MQLTSGNRITYLGHRSQRTRHSVDHEVVVVAAANCQLRVLCVQIASDGLAGPEIKRRFRYGNDFSGWDQGVIFNR